MGKQVLKVREDFYKKDFIVGETHSFFEGKYKILDTDYRNEHGVFILCEYLGEYEEVGLKSEVIKSIPAGVDKPFKMIGTIHILGYRNLLAGPGFYVEDRRTGEVVGMSFRETLQLLFNEGATNAEGFKTGTGNFCSSTIDSVGELPSFDSHYWKIPAYDENGVAFAKLTQAAKREVAKALRYAVKKPMRNKQ
ncbi:hypothetical protein [Litchfieldia alkalitelluris]|uniref:hypothetical protein n=1 Tax=Litchfieldia alkalitelluris TaxID=304268 RepID=UPI00099897C7|nr:hypothetical protein [Litchfieldia alkalitelluris]